MILSEKRTQERENMSTTRLPLPEQGRSPITPASEIVGDKFVLAYNDALNAIELIIQDDKEYLASGGRITIGKRGVQRKLGRSMGVWNFDLRVAIAKGLVKISV